MKKILTVKKDNLYINDEKFNLYSGTNHYFRIHPSQWRDRLLKLKLCGLNTVETYIAWNIQEPLQGQFTNEGFADFEKFISIAEELGLYVIVRPGPYICAEWEMGGLPSWLLNIENISLRHFNEPYLMCARKYFEYVINILKPHFSTNGGNIIAVQIENEYGGLEQPDTAYLEWIRNTYIELGVDILMFTSDGVGKTHLEDGSLNGTLMTANFGSRTEEAFKRLEILRPKDPKICMEFWNGWFDQWGIPHHTRDTDSIISELEYIINNNGHFNLYMFSGGTNFGFYNGSNCNPHFEPCITSYDYGAPLTESGEPTETYYRIKKLLTGERTCKELENLISGNKPKAYGEVKFYKSASVFDNLDELGERFVCDKPVNMERLGQDYGFILYKADVSGMNGIIDIGEVKDRAMFYGDGQFLGVYERETEYESINISGINELKILVENLGRVNYGKRIYDKKGIEGNVKIGGEVVKCFEIYTLPMKNIVKLDNSDISDTPMLHFAQIYIDETADTFIYPKGFTHGIIFINGFNLGRYRSKGPQQTLYVPKGILCKGENQIIILDLYKSEKSIAEFVDSPALDKLS